MKITTDACILGAWAHVLPRVKRVLDIGTGTGLLSLMLAQRNPNITIDAIEYDPDAAQQAKENTIASPWNDRINVIHKDVRNYSADTKYGLIICNPPFFTNSLLSDKHSKNLARHTVSLSTQELLTTVITNVADNGYLCILLPYTEYQLFKEEATQSGLYETQCLHIKHKPDAAVKRVVSILSPSSTVINQDENWVHSASPPLRGGWEGLKAEPQTLIIQNEEGDYTAHFKALLSPFYLNL